MPTELTFTSLKEDMRYYLERASAAYDTATSEQLEKWINLAERQICRELKIQGFQRAVTSAMTLGLAVYQKPDRWRETISMNFGTNVGTATGYNSRTPLREMSYESLIGYWPDRTQTGTPKFYADYDYNHWIIARTPDYDYPWEILYWELPPLLDDTTQTNWLTEFSPNALLHLCLVLAFAGIRNDDEQAKYQAMYDRDMAALAGEDVQKIIDRYYKRKTS